MRPGTILTGFQILLPRHHGPQAEALDWLAAAHARAESESKGQPDLEQRSLSIMQKLVRRYGCSPESIGERYSELDDFLHRDWDQMQIFNLAESSGGRDLDVRNRFFADTARRCLNTFFEKDDSPPTDLLHVTCTGYASPSAIQSLLSARGWHHETRATQIYHMGCYAALPTVRVASALLFQPQTDREARAEIVHTELCTLHFNPLDHSPEQIVVQGLFADGHIRYSVVPDDGDRARQGFRILAIHEEMIPDSLDDMTWVPSPGGFKMTLARSIPDRIASALPGFLERLFHRAGLRYADVISETVFAIHPGGPRIIDSIQSLLKLRSDQVATSRTVLFERGNMSSATLPHIWARMLEPSEVPEGVLVASLAFGPGLTLAGGLFRRQ